MGPYFFTLTADSLQMIDQAIESGIVAYDMEGNCFIGNLMQSPQMKRQMEIKIIVSHCGDTD
ncbi:hypothetical protein DSCO28_23040 [Desulfosarcina ovata subsp. sediminis]|uniref:Uncharacterized protein n=1 Tax=Desulfosarcina ovata subsp. sediminis TaxID=885957 RepID=A0A5K7ZHQ7_9BACT|nr:hypothetical protein DSCO28_23040 [Desulfosarcina ovata subsp. sediminis]